jgi:hypothetical protein
MIEERPIECDICHFKYLFVIYDQQRKIYICPKCCDKIGHQPPFTTKEFLKYNVPHK